ncbi:metalloregulator ArsR/SmtB family transcription factor [Henriciella mobilis]|uniref:ArsR family transcriptional regulator n=1 Tax=Henriciella mobilis TaxID=2305467 RepID=A0A399R619_9PROT|nr:metalloregulator ArsR/SmtB family transcription factor [Henriciella mobilis]RIJ14756.1 ArsR family transcriptional regulator [Henriciella mobilis]RIJ21713.1 ArsR family transcriptional regulator [Henriciella mobilis]RIJ26788.1 ArsR family transcriptional regulator [Henriciella mobilis]
MATSVFNALGHPLRRKVMMVLRKGPKTSGDLAGMFDASWPTVSRHLNVLKEADLITAERKGTSIVYRANTSVLEDAAAAILALVGRDDGDDRDDDMKEAAE